MRRAMRQRSADDVLQIELRGLHVGRILRAGTVAGILRNPGLDAGDVADTRAELVADRERRVDAGVDYAAAGIALRLVADLDEIERLAEIVEWFAADRKPARKRREEA